MANQVEPREVREAEDLVRSIFDIGPDHDVLLFQAEAVALLEAVARSLAVPGGAVGAVLTSVYGEDMALWGEASAARVRRLDLLDARRAVTVAEAEHLAGLAGPGAGHAAGTLVVVQGEALTGVVNPVDAIAARLAGSGTTLLVDSVSSVGAEPFRPRQWGRAASVIGFQKAMGGPAGVSVVVLDRALWADVEANPSAPRHSFLSLLDLRERWLDAGRAELAVAPNSEEVRALNAALHRVDACGIEAVEAQHAAARDQARGIVRALDGVTLAVGDADASGIATTFTLDDPARPRAGLLAGLAAAGVTGLKTGPGEHLVRWMHYDQDALPAAVEAAGDALRAVLHAR
ncbi:MAG TPA: aminotransferase class V-fold PLP-dependent enzyme [Cellulomonas sp.]